MTNYITISRADAELEHFGTKGMKWGVRKAAKLSARAKTLNRFHTRAEVKSIRKTEQQRLSNMTPSGYAREASKIRTADRAARIRYNRKHPMRVIAKGAAAGVGIYASFIGAGVAMSFLDSPVGRRQVNKGLAYLKQMGVGLASPEFGRAAKAHVFNAAGRGSANIAPDINDIVQTVSQGLVKR